MAPSLYGAVAKQYPLCEKINDVEFLLKNLQLGEEKEKDLLDIEGYGRYTSDINLEEDPEIDIEDFEKASQYEILYNEIPALNI